MGRADVTQATLAAEIGMSRASLSERLAGQRAFNTDQLAAIAAYLRVDVFSLMVPPAPAAESVSA
jgi:transcriptional regulator with XRE-family HTH domain